MWNYRLILLISFLCIFALQGPEVANGLDYGYVENFDIYPQELNIGNTPQTVTVSLHLVNGSDYQILPLMEPPKALFKSTFPNSDQIVPVEFKNVGNGIFKGTAKLNSKNDSGTWKLVDLRLTDFHGDVLDLRSELVKNNISTEFIVKQSGMGSKLVYVCGFLVILFLGFLYIWWSGWQWPAQIYKGDDGTTSASKLQLLIWTIVAIFSYSVIYADRVLNHNTFAPPSDIPSNLLLAMGLSVGTTLAAKFVTGTQVRSGKVNKQIMDNPKGGIFLNDDGEPDLSKIQMIAWTFVAVGIYLISVYEIINTNFLLPTLPDINPTLLALMGIGEMAYVGKKLVTIDDPNEPRFSTISPEVGSLDTLVTLTGLNFGEYSTKDGKYINDATRKILIGNKPIDDPTLSPDFEWSNTQIKFRIPQFVGGERMAPRDTEIGLIANDKRCSSTKSFKVIDPVNPYLYNINPSEGAAGSDVILTGIKFGYLGQILIDDKPLDSAASQEVAWTTDRIDFKIPSSIKLPLYGLRPKLIKIQIKSAAGIKSQNWVPFKVIKEIKDTPA
jgi:hypothetical protein